MATNNSMSKGLIYIASVNLFDNFNLYCETIALRMVPVFKKTVYLVYREYWPKHAMHAVFLIIIFPFSPKLKLFAKINYFAN